MKEIKDYLHLYLGCECMWYNQGLSYPPVKGRLVDISIRKDEVMLLSNDDRWSFPKTTPAQCVYLKPILRPLSDMTEEEAINVYTIERDRMLHPPNDHDVRRGDGCWKIVRLDLIDTTLFVTDDGVIYKVTEDNRKPLIDYTRNMPLIVHYLLSRSFDLFNLIPKGLAISKTTHP